MAYSIYLDNYRGFQTCLIPIEQVNYLVGENSSGKSSFLELLDTICSTSFWAYDAELNQSQLRRRHFFDIVSKASRNKSSFTIGVLAENGNKTERHGMMITYKNKDGWPKLSRFTKIFNDDLLTLERPVDDGSKLLAKTGRYQPAEHEPFSMALLREHSSRKGLRKPDIPDSYKELPLLIQAQIIANPNIQPGKFEASIPEPFAGITAMAPIRTRPLRTYDGPQTPFSREGKHTPYVIQKKLTNKHQAESFQNSLMAIGKNSGLFESVHIKEYGKGAMRPFELDITLGKHNFSLENVGYGVSQALPLIVEMLVRPAHTTFSIQQPEVHLHPRAQAAMGDLVAELARMDSKNFFIETHSDYTLDRYRINLKKNPAPKVGSQILFFERKDDKNNVFPISIDSSGNISPDQPDSYRQFFVNEQIDLLM